MAIEEPFAIYPPDPPLSQPSDGYRYSIDALLLASFACPKPMDRVVDLGAGCGVISIVLAHRFPNISITAIELQQELCTMAAENFARHGLDGRAEVVMGDINGFRTLFAAGSFDYAVSNPPFRPVEAGRICPAPGEAVARHEIALDLNGLLRAVKYLLRPGGRLAMIYPAERLATLLAALRHNRLEPKRLVPVYPARGRNARLVMVEACRDGAEELQVLPPVYIDEVVERDLNGEEGAR